MNKKRVYLTISLIILVLVVVGYTCSAVFDFMGLFTSLNTFNRIMYGIPFVLILWGVLYAVTLFLISLFLNCLNQKYREKRFRNVGKVDILAVVKDAWKYDFDVIKRCALRVKMAYGKKRYLAVIMFILNLPILFAMGVFGFLATAILSLSGLIVIGIILGLKSIVYFIVVVCEQRNISKHKVKCVCPDCKNTFDYPIYVCPDCHREYYNLLPSLIEIFSLKCLCGRKLPTTHKKRSQLSGLCPYCKREIIDKESQPLVINVVGAPRSGKTAYITALICDLVEEEAPIKRVAVSAYNMEMQKRYEENALSYFNLGHIRDSYLPETNEESSTENYSFFLANKKLKRDRLLHIFDINGELFINHAENEMQLQYSYASGFILVVDPLTIDKIRLSDFNSLSKADLQSYVNYDMNYVFNTFMTYVREIVGLKENEVCDIPLAICLGKIDCLDINKRFSKDECERVIRQNKSIKTNEEALDFLTRQFLIENGQANIVNNATMKFKHNRFFPISSMGHSKNEGRYSPFNTLSPFKWIVSIKDKKLSSLLNK